MTTTIPARFRRHCVVVEDDAGWIEGCPDYWGVFFGERFAPDVALTSRRTAERLARHLRETFDDDGQGKPTYGVVTIDTRDIRDAMDLRDATGWRAVDDDDVAKITGNAR